MPEDNLGKRVMVECMLTHLFEHCDSKPGQLDLIMVRVSLLEEIGRAHV